MTKCGRKSYEWTKKLRSSIGTESCHFNLPNCHGGTAPLLNFAISLRLSEARKSQSAFVICSQPSTVVAWDGSLFLLACSFLSLFMVFDRLGW